MLILLLFERILVLISKNTFHLKQKMFVNVKIFMLLEEKNNDFLNTEKFIESNKKNFVFSEDRNLVVIFFNVIPFCNSSREVVDFVLFNNRSELL